MGETAGYVLVGGKSSRFGRDKALLDWRGQPLALHVADRVRAAAGDVTLIGSSDKYSFLGLRIIPDPIDNFGPLAGVLAALEDSTSKWNLITACDMPHLTTEFLGFLLEQAAGSGADVTLPVSANGIPEPLCAVYSLQARGAIRQAVGRGVHKITRAFEGLQVRELLPDEYASFDPEGKLFTNVNRPEDLDTRVRGRRAIR